ncbi:DUF2946 domain-containing protein [Leclercia pneumoniae]|uniref:DUF2946 domain-containing protein n=1 Tax=Leclercia pneumoniae TaxID=2815358 RepID=A0ABX8K3R6_9ENTR|nr:DUF2946 domain-containing protein [Leclercia pneumoniae]KGB02884.1 hypothetical protein DR73_3155 [Enterobacteriaceae bacterium ATCC 29904]MCE6962881.1 DUF2946 domain-containing protein [Enterobacter sp. MW07]QSW34519.1 DUF2946 domain-containing protein [Leclercia pneumoniae]QWW80557.1 DUF2946 domain-containing protein [Leclercia pneumoniae]
MTLNRQLKRWQRAAAWSALFAILLIVVAPLISVSLNKDPMSAMPGMHHEMSMAEHHAMPHDMPHDMSHNTPESLPIDHAEACGYCVLLAHVPGLLLALVVLLAGMLLRQRVTPVRPVVKHWYFFPWLYPDTRAPPRRSAFSL